MCIVRPLGLFMYAIEDSVCPDGGSVLRECETGEGIHSWHPLRCGSVSDAAVLPGSCLHAHWWVSRLRQRGFAECDGRVRGTSSRHL